MFNYACAESISATANKNLAHLFIDFSGEGTV